MDILSLQKGLFPVLWPISLLYALGMHLRRYYWENFTASHTCTCPCVSVGNISWGGTGKTPLVEYLMHWAKENKIKAAVLSRAYKVKPKNPPVRILPTHSPKEVGDEPLMLARGCPQIPVIADPVRRRSATYAEEREKTELIILDDGFQHLPLKRNLNLVLLSPQDMNEGWNKVIPAGSWRESVHALSQADAFLFKCSSKIFNELEPFIQKRLKKYQKPVFSFFLEPQCLCNVLNSSISLSVPGEKPPYIIISGVGHPEQVKKTVHDFMGYEAVKHIIYPDHHIYTKKDITNLYSQGCMIICTAKDAIKLQDFSLKNIWYLQTKLRFGPYLWSEEPFSDRWQKWWRRINSNKDYTGF